MAVDVPQPHKESYMAACTGPRVPVLPESHTDNAASLYHLKSSSGMGAWPRHRVQVKKKNPHKHQLEVFRQRSNGLLGDLFSEQIKFGSTVASWPKVQKRFAPPEKRSLFTDLKNHITQEKRNIDASDSVRLTKPMNPIKNRKSDVSESTILTQVQTVVPQEVHHHLSGSTEVTTPVATVKKVNDDPSTLSTTAITPKNINRDLSGSDDLKRACIKQMVDRSNLTRLKKRNNDATSAEPWTCRTPNKRKHQDSTEKYQSQTEQTVDSDWLTSKQLEFRTRSQVAKKHTERSETKFSEAITELVRKRHAIAMNKTKRSENYIQLSQHNMRNCFVMLKDINLDVSSLPVEDSESETEDFSEDVDSDDREILEQTTDSPLSGDFKKPTRHFLDIFPGSKDSGHCDSQSPDADLQEGPNVIEATNRMSNVGTKERPRTIDKQDNVDAPDSRDNSLTHSKEIHLNGDPLFKTFADCRKQTDHRCVCDSDSKDIWHFEEMAIDDCDSSVRVEEIHDTNTHLAETFEFVTVNSGYFGIMSSKNNADTICISHDDNEVESLFSLKKTNSLHAVPNIFERLGKLSPMVVDDSDYEPGTILKSDKEDSSGYLIKAAVQDILETKLASVHSSAQHCLVNVSSVLSSLSQTVPVSSSAAISSDSEADVSSFSNTLSESVSVSCIKDSNMSSGATFFGDVSSGTSARDAAFLDEPMRSAISSQGNLNQFLPHPVIHIEGPAQELVFNNTPPNCQKRKIRFCSKRFCSKSSKHSESQPKSDSTGQIKKLCEVFQDFTILQEVQDLPAPSELTHALIKNHLEEEHLDIYGLQFLETFCGKFTIPSDITALLLEHSILDTKTTELYFNHAYQIFEEISSKTPGCVKVSWETVYQCLEHLMSLELDTEKKPRKVRQLELLVNVVKADLYARDIAITHQIHKSMAFGLLAYDVANSNRKEIVNFLRQGILGNCFANDAALQQRVVRMIQTLISVCVDVSSSCVDCANALARDLLTVYTCLPSLTEKHLLVNTITSPLLTFKVCQLVLETQYLGTKSLDNFGLPNCLADIRRAFFKAVPLKSVQHVQSESDEGEYKVDMSRFNDQDTEQLSYLLLTCVTSYLKAFTGNKEKSLRHRIHQPRSEMLLRDEIELRDFEEHVECLKKHLHSLDLNLSPKCQQYLLYMQLLNDVV